MIGPRPCAYACVYLDPPNLSVFLVLMLMSTQPSSLAYRCACAYAYAYCASENQA